MTEKPATYTDEEVAQKIQEAGLEGWYLEDGWLRRKISTDGWQSTLMVVNAVGYLCEAAWHHADLAVTWGKVWVAILIGADYRRGSPRPHTQKGASLASLLLHPVFLRQAIPR